MEEKEMTEINKTFTNGLLNLSFNKKIEHAKKQIAQFYDFFDGQVYVSFSGGKDSTVLLHLVRSMFPEVLAVFANTGVEYPELVQQVLKIDNRKIVPCKMRFDQIVQKYGYPVVSKTQAGYIYGYRTTKSEYFKNVRWNGKNGDFKISERWKFLVDAPFKISNLCCDILKKQPMYKFNKENKLRPFIGTKASDSRPRMRVFQKYGCNMFTNAFHEKSMPLNPWTDEDIWHYIKLNKLTVPSCYNYMKTTGCMYCLFGIQYHSFEQFDFLKKYHLKIYDYAIDKLRLLDVAKYVLSSGKDGGFAKRTDFGGFFK